MQPTQLTAVTRLQGNNAALKNGSVTPQGFDLKFEEVPVLVHAFRRMVRQLEFDVCEMALTTYLCAREHGVKFTALPVFLVRAFHHGSIIHIRIILLLIRRIWRAIALALVVVTALPPVSGRAPYCRKNTALI